MHQPVIINVAGTVAGTHRFKRPKKRTISPRKFKIFYSSCQMQKQRDSVTVGRSSLEQTEVSIYSFRQSRLFLWKREIKRFFTMVPCPWKLSREGGLWWTVWMCAVLMLLGKEVVYADTRPLVKEILTDYNRLVRPVINESVTVTVYHEIVPVNVISFDEVKQQLAVNVWLRMSWLDEFLTWDPEKFNGTAVVRIPANMLWKPDIVLYQSVDQNPLSGDLGLSCVVHSNGDVHFNTPYIFISYCKVDLTYYPFDTQRCPLKFGSWSFDETGVDIVLSRPEPELANYQPNGEWDLLDMTVASHKIKYSCCKHRFPDVEYTLVIERKPEFYVANIILPYVLISILSIFVFYLPPESGEKMNLSITTMLSLIVFNELVITTIPPASDGTFPIIGKYFVVMIAVVGMSVLMSVWVLHLYHKEQNSVPMPPFLRQLIFGWLARAVGKCKYRSHLTKNKVKDKYYTRHLNKRKYHGQDNGLLTKVRCFPKYLGNDSATSVKENLSDDFTNGSEEMTLEGTVEMIELGSDHKPSRVTVRLEREVSELARCVDYLTDRKRTKDTDEDFAREWRDAAAVVDRALLIVFTLVNITLPLFFLLSATGRFRFDE